MQKVISILLLTAITWQVSGRLQMLLLFKLNQNFIAGTLCQNKDNPSRGCKGKCYLARQMKQESERERKTSAENGNEQQNPVFFEQQNPVVFASFLQHKPNARYICRLTCPPLAEIYHPPGC